MVSKKMYEKMAVLAVRKGVNVQKGQPLIIRANVRDIEFVRMIVKEAYEAGASYVDVDWRDDELTRMDYMYQSMETLCDVPDYVHDREVKRHADHACYLNVLSSKPGNLAGIDSEKIRAASMASAKKMADLRAYTMNNEGQWSALGVPSMEWAKMVFPDLPEEEAFEKLGEAIFAVTRVSEDNDPCEEWDKHDEEMIAHAEALNKYQFEKLHFESGLGTDLTVELVKNHKWIGGGDETPTGIFFNPNMPTEEIFCMPHKERVNGIVYASKPLNYAGKLIENFWFRFENGEVVDYGAEKEADALKELVTFDEGSRRLGEVALVPYDSPISKSGILFFNTLYDENAACHLALGRAYFENLVGVNEMSEEERSAAGVNESLQHVDFMFGTADLKVDGIKEDGTVVPVFRNGNFVKE